jgi:hypothetical protein
MVMTIGQVHHEGYAFKKVRKDANMRSTQRR